MDERTLAQRLEAADMLSNAAYVRARAALDPTGGHTTLVVGDGVAVHTGTTSPINRVHNLGMSAPVTSAHVDQAEQFFNARGLPAAIDLCPLADSSLAAELRRRGYAVAGFKHVLWRDLADLSTLPPASEQVRVAIVTPDEAVLWARVVADAFAGAVSAGHTALDLPLPNTAKEGTLCFLAWIGDTPAGGGALALHQGTAVCYSTSVRPAVRRLGVQTALLTARLRHARDAGCDLAMVQTSPGSASQRNVMRFGFAVAFTKPTVVQGWHAGG